MHGDSVQQSFCTIHRLNELTVEVIPHAGVEIGNHEINEYHDFFNHLDHPVGVLVNRKNSYSYSFEGLMKIGKNKNMAAVAILTCDSLVLEEADFVASTIRGVISIEVFTDRLLALNWLSEHQSQNEISK